ncbi:MAG TPA: bifunctional glutamate N-acetyltransferase/amino-acid acetyltransferase ArgJ [Acidimicrobiales bacterium]|nr:bifunctional glutamate N-acetyltransferase/amino-acid acetyltransferase ArgJ [Acidimicrobiales bacterium]
MSVTAAVGFVANGVACGIKASSDLDLALVATEDGRPVTAAAVFTSNLAAAPPVQLSRDHLDATAGRAAAVIVNSGNANAATGATGRAHAERMAALVAEGLGCATDEVLVCSTGLIGIPLPIEAVESGVPALLASAGNRSEQDDAAAHAILTTDTKAKRVLFEEDGFTIGGMAKGAAMLAPNMATMLAVLTTDAELDHPTLQKALQAAVNSSFNAMIVDGCTSTNDTVIILASGRRGPVDQAAFAETLARACGSLSHQMAADAEGATKLARIRVVGAVTDADAEAAARKVAQSQLVQCSLYGEDPYWGRVVSELGSSGAAFDQDRVSVSYGGVVVCRDGVACDHDQAAVASHMAGRDIAVSADLGLGPGQAAIVFTDLGPGYIAENMTTS